MLRFLVPLLGASLLLATACAAPRIAGRAVNEAGRPLPGVRIATVPETRNALAGLAGTFVITERRIGMRTNKGSGSWRGGRPPLRRG